MHVDELFNLGVGIDEKEELHLEEDAEGEE